MAKTQGNNISIGSSTFYLILTLSSAGFLLWLWIWSYFNNSVKGTVIGGIFSVMIILGLIFSRFEPFRNGTWSSNSLSFVLGFSLWAFLLGGNTKSILSIGQNSLFANIATELPQNLEFVMNTFVIPIAEELFWLFAIAFTIKIIMDALGKNKSTSLASNKWLQLSVVALITGVSFALFHIGNLSLFTFLISAFVFRAVMIYTAWGDSMFDTIPGLKLLPSFAIGAHIGNNLADFGVSNGINLLTANLSIGIFIFVFFILVYLGAIDQIVMLFRGKGKGVKA